MLGKGESGKLAKRAPRGGRKLKTISRRGYLSEAEKTCADERGLIGVADEVGGDDKSGEKRGRGRKEQPGRSGMAEERGESRIGRHR